MTTETVNKPAAVINPKLIVPFINSVRSIFQTMVKVETKIDTPRLKADPWPTFDVSGIIGFSGDVIGNVVVSFQMATAQSLVTAFAGAPIDPTTPDFSDAIGELANMIAGGAKKHLGAAANITVPSVIIGHGHQIARLSNVPCIVIPCTTPVGEFAVEVNVKQIIQTTP
jgi:chemotaxis protein CheX